MSYRFHGHTDLEQIGEGNFGVVVKARDHATGRYVAVKYLKNFSNENLLRFKREAEALTRLNHNRFIVNVLRHETNSFRPHIVMEYCDHGSSEPWIGKVSSFAIIDLLSAMVSALKSVHEGGGIHRDIKPANILYHREGGFIIPKLSDFGVANVWNPYSQMTQTPRGTIDYMAPEVLAGGDHTQAADIYSLGITCLELATGKRNKSFLGSVHLPIVLQNLLRSMTCDDPFLRPALFQIEMVVNNIRGSLTAPFSSFLKNLSWSEVAAGGDGGSGDRSIDE